MRSLSRRLREFYKSYPKYKNFLNDHISKKQDKIKIELGSRTEKLIEKANKSYTHDTYNFKKSLDHDFKYKTELMKTDDYDFKLLYSSFELFSDDLKAENSFEVRFDKSDQTKILRMYRINSTNNFSTECSDSNYSKVLLLKKSNAEQVEKVLKNGFQLSNPLRLFDSDKMIFQYCYAQELGIVKKISYVLVNQVKYTDQQEAFKQKGYDKKQLKKEPVVRFFKNLPLEPKSDFGFSKENKYDSKNNKIFEGTFKKHHFKANFAVAHCKYVTPSYLIEIEEKPCLKEVVKDALRLAFLTKESKILYDYFHMTLKPGANKQASEGTNELTLKKVNEELRKKIASRIALHKKVMLLKRDNDINLMIKQLPLNIDSFLKTKYQENMKYKTELLQQENDDYKFILRWMSDKTFRNKPVILHVLKVNPVDKNEVSKSQNKTLHLYGIKSNNINNVLTYGYYNKASDSQSITGSTSYEKELAKGLSYCEVGGVVEKLSFVLVASLKYDEHKIGVEPRDRDSKHNLFAGDKTTEKLIPEYLIIFKV